MAEQVIRIGSWIGGMSDDEKVALNPGSFSFGQSLDFRHNLSILSVLNQAVKESGSTVDTEVHDAVSTNVNSGNIYMAGQTKLYKRTPGSNGASGSYSVEIAAGQFSGVRDLDYRQDIDTLFLIDSAAIHAYSSLSNSPTLTLNQYGNVVDYVIDTTGSTSTLSSAISETSTNLISWTVTKEPTYSVTIEVATKGTGDWTVTIHDALNRVVGTKTLANASVSVGSQEFVFSSQLRLVPGQTYHVHVTTSNSTGTITSTAPNTISTGSLTVTANSLVDAGIYGHYAMQFGAKTLICNERYLAEVEYNTTFDGQRLIFPADIVTTGLCFYNQYVVITAGRRGSSDSLNSGLDSGVLILWDGYSVFPEMIIDVPFGAPYAPINNENILQFIANGRIYQWAGGDFTPAYEFHGVDEFEASVDGPSVDVYMRPPRHGSTGRDSLAYFGFPRNTANTNVKIGAYSYGSIKLQMPRAASFDYPLSTGHTETQFNTATTPDTPITGITMLKNFGSNLLMAWTDYVGGAVTYGVDVINVTKASAAAASYESLWIDDGRADKDKLAQHVKVTFFPLPDNVTITPKIRFDRSDSWTYGTVAGAGTTEAILHVSGAAGRHKEAMIGFDVAISGSSTNKPKIISLSYKYDDLLSEGSDVEHE